MKSLVCKCLEIYCKIKCWHSMYRAKKKKIKRNKAFILLYRLALPFDRLREKKEYSVRFGLMQLPMVFLLHSPIIWPFGLLRFGFFFFFYRHFNFDFSSFVIDATGALLLWYCYCCSNNYRILTSLCMFVIFYFFFIFLATIFASH